MTPAPVKIILTDFRHDLESFYQRLQLAPPYDSVEKSVELPLNPDADENCG